MMAVPVRIEIDKIELLALKKLALICHALGMTLTGQARVEQLALTKVLVDVLGRANPSGEGR